MNTTLNTFFETLESHCRLHTQPVGVKLAKKEETAPDKTKYPVDHLGNPLAVCQGMTLARSFGWRMAFKKKDHACPLPVIFMGHANPDKFLNGDIARFYQDDPDCMKKMEASYPRWPKDTYEEVWLAPLNICEFVPDLVVMYGNPAQILALIQAANFGHGPGIRSVSSGRYGCSQWLAGAVQTGECTYMIPGPGERVFAGTQDHEVSFAVPYHRISQLVDGLKYIRRQGSYKFPVPTMGLLAKPRIPKSYFDIVADA
jgi:uncharacterized protein (DUF169 family)